MDLRPPTCRRADTGGASTIYDDLSSSDASDRYNFPTRRMAHPMKVWAGGAEPKEQTMKKAQALVKKTRGASMVEYALLIVAIMLLAAGLMRALGKQVGDNASKSTSELAK